MGLKTDNVGAGGSGKKSNQSYTVKDKIAFLLKKHMPLLERLGVTDPLFLPKTVYGNPLRVTVFPSELRNGKDIYTEKVSKDYTPEDENRTLYVLPYRADYDDFYDRNSFGPDYRYIVPFDMFQEVKDIRIGADKDADFGLPNPDEDAVLDELMITDLCAIIWRKPCSSKPWLNEFIKRVNNSDK